MSLVDESSAVREDGDAWGAGCGHGLLLMRGGAFSKGTDDWATYGVMKASLIPARFEPIAVLITSLADRFASHLCSILRSTLTGQERAVTDSRGHVSGDRAYHAMGASASAWRTTGQHSQLVRRGDPSRVVAVSNARPDTSDATAGAVSSLWHLGRVRTPSFRTLKVGSRTEDPRRRQGSPHAVGNVPRRQPKGDQHARQPCLSSP